METLISIATTAAVPLLLAALAVLLSSRAGVLNLATEGMMLGGAFVAAWVGAASGTGVGFAAAVLSGALAGLILGWVMVMMRADQVVVGVAYNIMVLGLTGYAAGVVTGDSRNALTIGESTDLRIPGLADIPGIGVIFDQNWIAYLAYVLVPIMAYMLFRTGLGTRLRATGEYSAGAQAMGINVIRTRVLTMAVSGAIAAIAGAYLVIGDLGLFRPNISGGRGYIAFVIVILARYGPIGSLLAAALFGLATALTSYLQLKGVHIASQFILATPYIFTLLAIIILGRRIGQPPAEEGRPLQLNR